MALLFDARCDKCGSRWEHFASDVGETVTCPYCQSPHAYTVQSPVRFKLDGTDPGFPTAWDRWAKVHEEAARKAEPETE